MKTKTERECTWCRYVRLFYGRDLARELEQYIESLPEEIRADEETHAARMAICRACPDNREGLCRHCGCYIAARTAKKRERCPFPGERKW
ncbi:MAG: hypothetical protein IKE24_08325 [Clostridia bacterium]|nr:hypothetical protein [Clostridia bacterium]